MSDLTKTRDNFLSMLAGKTDFNGFLSEEGALIEKDIAGMDAAVQPFLNVAFDSFKAGASSLVGAGESALGGIIAASSDTQATSLLNMMQAAGVPTNGVLTVAEHAALVTLINGAKAILDRLHLTYATPNAATAVPQP